MPQMAAFSGGEADVRQIVEDREERYLGELGDARDKDKFFEFVASLQYSEYITINVRAIIMFGCHP